MTESNIRKVCIVFPNELEIIYSIIHAMGGECRIIGGAVRDYLMDKTPVDFDIATNVPPQRILESFIKNKIKAIPLGIEYGTILVVVNNVNFEITTLRKDFKCFGRHAEVEFSKSWEEDASRRDFTINAMSITADRVLYDYFDGQNDLKKRIVRFIGNPEKRIQEDYLRILRYIRFLSILGLKNLDQESYYYSFKAIKSLKNISRPRIKKELSKILKAEFLKEILIVLYQKNLYEYVGLSQIFIKEDVLKQIVFTEQDWLANLAVLICLSEKKNPNMLTDIKDELSLSNEEFKKLKILCSFKHRDTFDNHDHYKYLHELDRKLYLRLLFVINNIIPLHEYKRYYQEALTYKPLNFPLRGEDLKSLKLQGDKIGQYLKIAKSHWHNNNNKLDRLSLMHFLSVLLKTTNGNKNS